MKKIIGILLALTMCFSLSAFDLTDVNDVKDAVDGYAKGLVDAIPTEVSADNLWADAYIGQLLALPPHLAAGITIGSGLTNDSSSLASFANITGIDKFAKLPGAPVPAASFSARVGGILLPFDVGFHGMFATFESENNKLNGSIDINSWGADIRFSLIKQKLVIPSISIGVGYDKVNIAADMNLKGSQVTFNFNTAGELVSGTAEISWKLLFIKLFGGARGLLPLNDGIKASASVMAAGTTLPVEYFNKDLSVQVFGGVGLRFLILDTTFGVTYDINKGNIGGSVSLRAQL